MLYIWPYKMGSMGARALAKSFPVLRVYPDRRFRLKRRKYVLNWGNSRMPRWDSYHFDSNVYNHPDAVANSVNKIKTLQLLDNGVEWSTNYEEAHSWVREGHRVFARHTVTGHGGSGISIHSGDDDLPYVPLYTKHFPVETEYRVHVFHDTVIDYTQKKRIGRAYREANGIVLNPLVRNHSNGWIFAREGVVLPEGVKANAVRAVDSLGLDFGAVDIAVDSGGNVKVFEVNSAPGIDGTTLVKYNAFLKEFFNV